VTAKITLLSEGQQVRSALTPEARRALTNNCKFRAATVRPRESTLTPKQGREAARALEERFGQRCPALTTEALAGVIRAKLCDREPVVDEVRQALRDLGMPGDDVLGRRS